MTNQMAATRRRYPAEYKFKILAECDTLERDAKGELLRREGLYTSLLSEWRKQRDRGALEALAALPGRPSNRSIRSENAQLRARVQKLEGDLETALTALQKVKLDDDPRNIADLAGLRTRAEWDGLT